MCSAPVHMCGEVWFSFQSQGSLHNDVNLLALRPPRDNGAGWEDLFLSRTLQCPQVGYLPSYAPPH